MIDKYFLEIIEEGGKRHYLPLKKIRKLEITDTQIMVLSDCQTFDQKKIVNNVANIDAIIRQMNDTLDPDCNYV